ncbi:MAG: alanine--glyoxylate aminotransferase family protein [Anaerolineaceae bacterium]|nr:alanine--glyoxylate aminotransferase family protein [Anaerolineaceae bacterium]
MTKTIDRPLLMIPGPIQPEPKVLKVMGEPVRAHYGPEWTELYNQTTSALKKIFHTEGDVFLMVGSGSCAIDACMGSAFSTGEKVLIGFNGHFGDRLLAVAEGYGLEPIPVKADWGKPLLPEDFEKAIRVNQDVVGICVVHLETSTTIINPIEEIGKIARKHNLCYFVDAVSSLGGLPMQMDDWNIDLCATASQKCLGAPPGIAPAAVGKRGWGFVNRNPQKGHGWYADLRVWQKYAVEWGDWHPFPITMATNNVVALKASIDNLLVEGLETRLNRYRELALRLRNGLRKIGMEPYTPDEIMSPVLTAAYGPEGVETSKIVTYMAQEHQIKIAGGLGDLKNIVIRIGHMAPTVSEVEIDQVLDALSQFR